jgi:HD-like signal output (HDOD) protein
VDVRHNKVLVEDVAAESVRRVVNGGLRDGLRERVERLRTLPASTDVLGPLLGVLRRSPEQLDWRSITEIVLLDVSIAAQALRIANSPFFARSRPVRSAAAAVLCLGTQRVEDVLLTCCMQRPDAAVRWMSDPLAFWKHSLACALLSRELAERIGFRDAEQAYLAGLLHDLGILVNLMAYGEEYRAVMAAARKSGAALAEEEMRELGFTHEESGVMLAEMWVLPHGLREVIRHHHAAGDAGSENPLIAVVGIADRMCRARGLGYGYVELRNGDVARDVGWEILAEHCPRLKGMDVARFTMELGAFVNRVQATVDAVFAARVEHEGAALVR